MDPHPAPAIPDPEQRRARRSALIQQLVQEQAGSEALVEELKRGASLQEARAVGRRVATEMAAVRANAGNGSGWGAHSPPPGTDVGGYPGSGLPQGAQGRVQQGMVHGEQGQGRPGWARSSLLGPHRAAPGHPLPPAAQPGYQSLLYGGPPSPAALPQATPGSTMPPTASAPSPLHRSRWVHGT